MAISHFIRRAGARTLKKVGLAIACEVGYAFVIFSSINMISSLMIEVDEGTINDHSSYSWNKIFIGAGFFLLITANFANVITLNDAFDVGTYWRKHSLAGLYAPLLYNTKIISLTVLLYLNINMHPAPSVFVLMIQFMYCLFVCLARPHKRLLDIVRSTIVEFALFWVLLIRLS